MWTKTAIRSTDPSKAFRHPRRLIGAALGLILAAVLFFSFFAVGAGHVYPRSLRELDLRAEALPPKAFDRLQARLRNCHIRWSVPVGDKSFDSESTTLYIGSFAEDDIPLLTYFPNLRKVDGSKSESYDALLALRTARPDLEVRWGVDIGGSGFSQGSQILRVKAENLTAGELMEKLPLLPELNKVTVTGAMDFDEQAELAKAYPHILFDWDVELLGSVFPSLTTELSYTDRTDLAEADLKTLEEHMFLFPNLEVIDLTGCGFDNERLMALREAAGAEVNWQFELFGRTFSALDTEIDLSDIEMEDTAAVEAALPLFSRLEKVVMCDCGISNEEMDALNNRYESIRFVWRVYFGSFNMRTDETAFIAAKHKPWSRLNDRDVDVLKYCSDLIALDLGHMYISDISFLYSMPHMKYLILADNPIRDITPVAGLQELIFAELFWCYMEDLTPLLGCTALEDLNLSYVRSEGEHTLSVLSQMTWLDRLWYTNNELSREQQSTLRNALPDCEMKLDRSIASTGGTWRQGQNYYDMRDLFGMKYDLG